MQKKKIILVIALLGAFSIKLQAQYFTEMPEGFKEKDDKWPKWTPEPGLHFGYNF